MKYDLAFVNFDSRFEDKKTMTSHILFNGEKRSLVFVAKCLIKLIECFRMLLKDMYLQILVKYLIATVVLLETC